MKSKFLKRILACGLALSFTIPVFAGCAGDEEDESEGGVKTYTVSLESEIPEACTLEKDADKYMPDSYATVTATTKRGYVFNGWYDKETNEFLGASETISVPVEKNMILFASYVREGYEIQVERDPRWGGTATGAAHYNYGDNLTLNATSNFGYDFVGWYDKSDMTTPKSDNLEYKTTVEGEATYVAKWNLKKYSIGATVNYAEAGTIVGAGDYEHGELVTLTAKPNQANENAYEWDGWYEGETRLSRNPEYSFTAISGKNLTAKWNAYTYNVYAHANDSAAGEVSGAGEWIYGSQVTLTATTKNNAAFLGWYENGVKIEDATGLTYTFTASADRNITAKWETSKPEYTISVDKNYPGAGKVVGVGDYAQGEEVSLSAASNFGYTFLGWYNGSDLVSASNPYVFVAQDDVELEAKWDTENYVIEVEQNLPEAGTVTGANDYTPGSSVTLTATPNTGYTFLGWFEGDDTTPVETNLTYAFEATTDRTLIAKFEINKYVINVTKNVDKAGTVEGAATYEHGQKVTLTAQVNSGYEFIGWFEGDVELSKEETYEFTATSNKNITAKYFVVLSLPSGNHTLEIMVYEAGYGKGWIEKAADRFEAKYPGYTINVSSDANMFETLKLQLLNDSCEADIALISDANYKELSTKNKLVSVDDILDSKLPDATDSIRSIIPDSHLTYRDINGVQYGLPWQDNTVPGIIYNKGFFDENGLSVPTTMDEYFELCQEIVGLGKVPLTYSGLVQYGYTQNILNQWFLEDVGEDFMVNKFLKYDNIQNFVDTEETRVKAYSMLAKMLKTTSYVYENASSNPAQNAITQLLRGDAMMLICGPWFATEAALQLNSSSFKNFEYGFFGIPHINPDMKDKYGNDSSYLRYSLASNSLVIPQTSDEKAAAKLFLAELYSEECLSIFVTENNGVSRPMTITPEVEIDTSTKKGAFSADVFNYFKGTMSNPTTMIYEISTAKIAQAGYVSPCITIHTGATNGDTLQSIIGAKADGNQTALQIATQVAVQDAKAETAYVKDMWDYTTGTWKAAYTK